MYYLLTLKLFKRAYGRYWPQIIFLALLGFFGASLEGIGATALIPLFHSLTQAGEAGDLISKAIGQFLGWFGLEFSLRTLLPLVVILFILKGIVFIISQYISVRISADYERNIRSVLFLETLKSKWTFLIGQKIGYLETILIRDAEEARGIFLCFGEVIVTTASLLVYVLVAFNISPVVTSLSLAMGVVIFFFIRPVFYKIRELSRIAASAYSDMSHHVSESIIGLKTIRASLVEDSIHSKANEFFDLLKLVRIRVLLLRAASSVLIEPVSIIFISVIFAFSYVTNNFEIGTFAATIYLVHKTFRHIQNAQATLYRINESLPYLQRIMSFRDTITVNREMHKGTKPFSFNNYLEFNNITFGYGEGKQKTLCDFFLKVKMGEMVGIIGESGAGKTTLVDLLLRLLEPQGGKILADGVDISEIDIKEWRKNIGYVSQDIFVINDSVENNIRFYDDNISDRDTQSAAQRAYIYDFIEAQPNKFKTQVGERGVLLSGGEKQRIVLARYLARNSKILILDEATSALDNKSELMIKKAINELRGKVTIFIIAHRLSTLLNCDRVVFLENGKIVEDGSPRSLLEDKSSRFYKLYHIADEQWISPNIRATF